MFACFFFWKLGLDGYQIEYFNYIRPTAREFELYQYTYGVVEGCTNRWVDSSLSFHRISKEEKQLWLNVIKRKHYFGLRPTVIEFVDCNSFQVWTVLIASIKRYKSWAVVAGT